ncbi:hypothetical protein ACA910_017185 [Epithemia clementina (nom. ined.)]
MVTLRTSSMDMEDHSGGRARKIPRGPPPPDGVGPGGMGMPPHAINAGPPRGRVGPPMGGPPPLPPGAVVGPRTTATSRRGGRTRARSPIVASNGGGGGGPVSSRRSGSNEPPSSVGRPSSASSDRRALHGKGDNPSSAAAAAAAAAKAFSDSNNAAPRSSSSSQWPDRHHPHHHYDDRGYPQMAPGYGDKSPYMRAGSSSSSSKKWPPNPHDDPKLSGHYSQHTYGGPYGYDGYPGPYSDRRYRSSSGSDRGAPPPPPPPHHHHHPHHQYKDMRGMGPDVSHRGSGGGGPESVSRGGPMYHPHPHHHHPSEYHHRAYLGGGRPDGRRPPPSQPPPPALGPPPSGSSKPSRSSPTSSGNGGPAAASSSTSGGGKSLVIGGTTPIHVPKTEVHPDLAERPNRALTRSVFRGCDTSVGDADPVDDDDDDDDRHPGESNPQKIILSFKTPTSSFDDNNNSKKMEDSKRPASSSGQTPLSPKEPPQLHSTTQQRSSDVFERSPEGNKNAPSIDIAPSFTLFNTSFGLEDGLGENYLDVESTLHADSFGMMRTASNGGEQEGMTSVLRRAFSQGNGSTQLLAPSASGHLTIGYSPVNSFGTAPPPRREASGGGSVVLLGGPEGRSSSPTQVFSAYNHGYGGGVGRSGPLDDSHLRMSVGSFGAHSYGGRHGPYGEPGPPHGYGGPVGGPLEKHRDDGTPYFYVFLKKYKLAFSGCSFLLPGLKAALAEKKKDNKNNNESDSDSQDADKDPPRYPHMGDPTPHDLVIAQRRVESSVCAFGGSSSGKDVNPVPNESGSSSSHGSSIFRDREKSSTEEPTATVTPSSSVASPPRQSSMSKHKAKYEEELPGRYYENDSRLSWEFEENPPVEVSQNRGDLKGGKNNQDKRDVAKSSDDTSTASKRLGASSPPASKMRYRCKLCGQPKQNHTCPYQQSLARSIGIMVYPAVNAFTAAEPGSIAPALSEMNNFTDLSEKGSVNESSPGRSGVPLTSPKQVTPESARPSPRQLQLASPPTTPGRTPTRSNTAVVRRSAPSRGQKRPHGYEGRVPDDQGDLLFVEAMELKPQQFLTVSEAQDLNSADAFSYLALPLPYAQRKRLSDNLFSLSNEVPKLTDECAQVLREAREKDKWDLAVAELMTQVIVVLHCRDGDHRFEGLRQYLLTLGIAC